MFKRKQAVTPKAILLWGTGLFIFGLVLAGCQRGDIPVHIIADQQSQTIRTSVLTVRELLTEANVSLGELDRVNPDLYKQLEPNMTIEVIRVREELITDTITIPFERQIVTNEGLPEGEQRLAQLGVNGQEQIVTKIIYENGVEVEREQVSKTITQETVEEILVVGGRSNLPNILFEGTVAYLSGGNAWIMNESNTARRTVTTEGDLDGRVFDLSTDGNTLLYSRVTTTVIDAPLNELWLVNTRIVGEDPISLPLTGTLYAEWSPVVTQNVIAYSTGQRVSSQPGWRANNDLWLWDINTDITEARQIISPTTQGLYPWWGTTYTWSPDGQKFAFANANQIGIIDVLSQTSTILAEFTPFETNSEWVWVPTVSWSPDSQFIATIVHGPPLENQTPETSQVFDVWLMKADGTLKLKAWEQAGMWSNPVWHSEGIAFGRAVNPLQSINSRYKLATIDRDGSNPEVIFPTNEAVGLDFPEMVWKPGQPDVIFVYQNNLHLLGKGASLQQLTTDNQSHRPQWVISAKIKTPAISGTITSTQSISATPSITATRPVSN